MTTPKQVAANDQATLSGPVNPPTEPSSDLENPSVIRQQLTSFFPTLESLAVPLQFAQFRSTANTAVPTKRIPFEDLENLVDKKVKASHDPSDPGSPPPLDTAHNPGLPVPSTKPARQTAVDFRNTDLSTSDTSSPQALSSSFIGLPTMSSDLMKISDTSGSRPTIPLEAIGTLQQASADMLNALVNKAAVDREKQLLVAVGTLRTCLDVDFVPYMDMWKRDLLVTKAPLMTMSPTVGKIRSQSSVDTSGPPGKYWDKPHVQYVS